VKKIVIISAVFPPEPIVSAKISFDLATELSKNNDVTVVCPRPSRPFGFNFGNKEEGTSFKVNVVDSYTYPESNLLGRVRESLSFGLKCKTFIEKNKREIDIIYMNAWPLISQSIILSTALKSNIQVITHIQDIYPESYINNLPGLLKCFFQRLLLPIDKYVLKNSSHILAISEKMKDYLINTRFLESSNITVVTNWQDENDFVNFHHEKNEIQNSDKLTFMYLGNIGPVAGVEFLIESFAEAKLPGSKLIVAGSGSMKEYCRNQSLRYADSEIEFIDVPAGKVPEIQDLADVMLLPVRKGAAFSSIPSKLPAYMFSKKPIVGCVDKNSDTADSIINSECGWVIEPENKMQLIELFNLIYAESSESRVRKGENGYRYAMEKFSKVNNLKKITELLIK
jgi:glycosyltransferase involved in cell wall biosynthesis